MHVNDRGRLFLARYLSLLFYGTAPYNAAKKQNIRNKKNGSERFPVSGLRRTQCRGVRNCRHGSPTTKKAGVSKRERQNTPPTYTCPGVRTVAYAGFIFTGIYHGNPPLTYGNISWKRLSGRSVWGFGVGVRFSWGYGTSVSISLDKKQFLHESGPFWGTLIKNTDHMPLLSVAGGR